jgi:multiple sugar transport system substrate-binding protein
MAKMMAGIESGDLPDLVQVSGEVPQLYGTDALVDVTAVVQELIKDNGDVYKLNVRGGNFKGKWWGVPWFMYADAFFVRKDVLTAGGKKIEDAKTFDQRRQMALELSDPAKPLWGWGMTPKDATGDGDILARHVINSWGGSITDESGEKVKLDTPETVAAVAWIQETYTDAKWKKMLPDGVLGWTGSSNNETYLGGKIIFTQNASSLYWAMNNQKNVYYKDTQLVQFPIGPKNELMGGYPYYHITFKKSKQRDAAIDIAKMQVEKKRQVERTKIAEGQSWPVYQKLNDDPEIQAFIKSDPGYETLFKNCTHQSGWSVGWPAQLNPALATVENQTTLTKLIDDAANNKGKPEQLVKDYHKRAVDIFNSLGMKQ